MSAPVRTPAGAALPAYGEGSLAELLPSVLGALGIPGEVDVLGLPPTDRCCVLLVDALGWNALRTHPAQTPFLHGLVRTGRAITSALPSTTVTSLATLGTGLPPGRHGLVGYTSRLPGSLSVLNALSWDPAVDPYTYQPHPTVLERAAAAGVTVRSVGRRRFRQSGLTLAALRGPAYRGADTAGELVAAAADALRAGRRALVYVYDSDLDATGHSAGCTSPAWAYQLAHVDRLAEQLDEVLPPGAVLVITGDHGMVDVPADARVDADAVGALRDGVELIAGECRFRHVYSRAGAATDVRDAWAGVLGDTAVVLTRPEAVAAGWFGPVEARVADRIGDVVAAMLGSHAVLVPSQFPQEARLVGMHGSLTEDEVLVPLLTSS